MRPPHSWRSFILDTASPILRAQIWVCTFPPPPPRSPGCCHFQFWGRFAAGYELLEVVPVSQGTLRARLQQRYGARCLGRLF